VLDKQAVPADLDVGGTVNRLEYAEDGHFDFDQREFRLRNPRESRVGAAGGHRASCHDLRQQVVGLEVADAPTQFASLVKRDKRATATRGQRFRGEIWRSRTGGVRRHRVARDPKQAQPVGCVRHDGKRPIAPAM
jgi:hypothetical protein